MWTGRAWDEQLLPADIAADIPKVAGETERCWHYLAREFVRDIRGEAVDPYPTFRKGSAYQRLIDFIRDSEGWTNVPHLA